MKFRSLVAVTALAATLVPTLAGAAGFHGTHTTNGADVWAVGDAGTIYRSLNGGLNWAEYTLGNEALRAVTATGLTAIVVSDSGKIWRSVDAGGGWALTVVTGAPDLFAVAMPSANVAYAAGESGTIMKSVNGGANWSPQTSGTGETLRALRFTDEQNGWAVGDNATVLRTTNGGANWSPQSVGAYRNLLDVDQNGSTVWIVGEDGTAVKSTNSGGNWSPVNLEFDDLADVRMVRLESASSVILAGGGGFIRRSFDGGTTWFFDIHNLHGRITDAAFFGDDMWVTNADNRVVTYTTNGGANWNFPAGATLGRGWAQKLGPASIGTVRGSTIQNHPTNKRAFIAVLGPYVFKSWNDGETWTNVATIPLGGNTRTNAFVVSPKDTNLWVAACDSAAANVDLLMRTTNGGASWSKVMRFVGSAPMHFGTYGIPLEMHPDKPDTLLFGPDGSTPSRAPLYRSTDFGATWAPFSTTEFRSPCDIVITPGNSSIVHVGDGITSTGIGDIWRSTDGGVNFTLVQSMDLPGNPDNSEVPGMATSRLMKSRVFGSGWGGDVEGLWRSTNSGASYSIVNPVPSGWGVDVCKEDPNVVMFGQYSGCNRYLSLDGGDTFTSYKPEPQCPSNYSFYVRDRATIIAEESTGLFKMTFNYAYTPAAPSQSVTVTAPNGGESWAAGSTQSITWSASGLAATRIEYRRQLGDPWQVVADVPGYQTSYSWLVPNDATTTAKVRVRDLWDGSPTDSSNAVFTIGASTALELLVPDGGQVWQYGTSHDITWNSAAVSHVDLELRTTDVGEWIPIATSVPAGSGAYAWVIPNEPTASARVRVSQTGGGLIDLSSAPFTITVPLLEVAEDPYYLGGTLPNNQLGGVLQLDNPGTAPLTISSATVNHASFWLGRSSLVIPAGDNDTLGVFYKSASVSSDTALVTLTADDPASPRDVTVTAYTVSSLAAGDPPPASFALAQNQPNPFGARTTIHYALPVESNVTLEVFDVQGHRVATLARGTQGPGRYAVSFGRGVTDADGRPLGALSAGVYFARFQAGPFSTTRKMLLMR